MRAFLFTAALSFCTFAYAQPDTLYVPDGNNTRAYAVVYAPVEPSEQYTITGHYAHAPGTVAVELKMKRGKPSGVYRAFYPSGRPLIFAVYGYGSLHGDWTEYDEQGRVTLKGQYRNGTREGIWAFRSQGIVGHYKKGLMHGKWKYFEKGKLARVSKYYNGKLRKGSEFYIR